MTIAIDTISAATELRTFASVYASAVAAFCAIEDAEGARRRGDDVSRCLAEALDGARTAATETGSALIAAINAHGFDFDDRLGDDDHWALIIERDEGSTGYFHLVYWPWGACSPAVGPVETWEELLATDPARLGPACA